MLYSVLTILAAPALAAALKTPRAVQESGIVRFPVEATERSASVIGKRQKDAPTTAYSNAYFYTVDVAIGTPGQTIKLHLDTGSSEMWVNPDCKTAGESESALCNSFARFLPDKSDTFTNLKTPGEIQYGSGGVKFIYGKDTVAIGGASLKNQQFGVAYESTESSTGLLGVGPSTDGFDQNPYPFVLDNLFTQGYINSRAFSLDLRGIDSARGSITFGGIDTSKFSGPLEKKPILDPSLYDNAARYVIALDGISITKDDGTVVTGYSKTGGGLPVLMDSGYSISTLPAAIVKEIAKAFPSAKKDTPASTSWNVDCSEANKEGTVDFKFGNTVINVPYKDFIARSGEDSCLLGFEEANMAVLGDTFLRAAYVVYDYDNRNIHLANNEDCGTSLIAIGKGANAVPAGLVGDCQGSGVVTTSSSVISSTTTSSVASSTTEQATTTSEAASSSTTSEAESSTATSEAESSTASSEAQASSTESQSSETAGASSSAEVDPASTTSASAVNTSEAETTTSTWDAQSTTASSAESTETSSMEPGSGNETSSTTSEAAGTTGTDSTSALEVSGSATASSDSSSEPAGNPGVTSTVVVIATESATPAPTSVESVTTVYTITSCPPEVTNCPVGSVTTETIKASTTTAPATTAPATLTSTITTSKVYTITSCPPEVKNCPVGAVTTEIVTSLTTYCPGESMTTKRPEPPVSSVTSTYLTTKTYVVTECPFRKACTEVQTTAVLTGTCVVDKDVTTQLTKTYTAYQTITCGKSTPGCEEGSVKTITELITPKPSTAQQQQPTPTPQVPVVSTWVPVPSGKTNGTNAVSHPPVVTSPPVVAGASKTWGISGFAGAIVGLVVAAAM